MSWDVSQSAPASRGFASYAVAGGFGESASGELPHALAEATAARATARTRALVRRAGVGNAPVRRSAPSVTGGPSRYTQRGGPEATPAALHDSDVLGRAASGAPARRRWAPTAHGCGSAPESDRLPPL